MGNRIDKADKILLEELLEEVLIEEERNRTRKLLEHEELLEELLIEYLLQK
jgi:hypothetical protein